MKKSKAVWIDGTLYVSIASFLFIQGYFTSAEAYKYVSPYFLFWLKFVVGLLGTIAGSMKMFRSTSYSDHLKQQALDNPPGKEQVPKA